MPSIRQRFHLSPCSDFRSHFCSLTHPLPLSSRRPSVSFGGFGLRVEPKDGANVLGGSQSYATAEEFESPQVLAMNWWATGDSNYSNQLSPESADRVGISALSQIGRVERPVGEQLPGESDVWSGTGQLNAEEVSGGNFQALTVTSTNPESTEGGRLVSILKWPEGALFF